MSWKVIYSVYINVATSRTYSGGGGGDRIFPPLLSVTARSPPLPPVSLIDPRRPCIIPRTIRGTYCDGRTESARRKFPAEKRPPSKTGCSGYREIRRYRGKRKKIRALLPKNTSVSSAFPQETAVSAAHQPNPDQIGARRCGRIKRK